MAKFPHCDQRVLHAPGFCEYCDLYPAEQQSRFDGNINFTGENDPQKLACPSQAARPLDVINKWPGNRPKQSGRTAGQFLMLLADQGGVITSSNDHSPEEIQRARDEDRFYVDANSFGYVWDSLE